MKLNGVEYHAGITKRVCGVAFYVAVSMLTSCSTAVARPESNDEYKEEATRLVALITASFPDGSKSYGAGIIFGRDNNRLYIVTANHVARPYRPSAKLTVKFRWLPNKELKPEVLPTFDQSLDLAVLSVSGIEQLMITPDTLLFPALVDPKLIWPQQGVRALGFPKGMPWKTSLLPDWVTQVSPTWVHFESPFVAQGHSGGALVNEQWELIGMVTGDSPPDGIALRLDTIIERLRNWGYPINLSRDSAPHKIQFQTLSAGDEATCGLSEEGIVYCWGETKAPFSDGLLISYSSSIAVRVPGRLRYRAITVGKGIICAITLSGAAYCWGSNAAGALGNNSNKDSLEPVGVIGGLVFSSITAHSTHVCGITTDQSLYCWGDGSQGQLGDGSNNGSRVPKLVRLPRRWLSVSVGYGYTCGITDEQRAYCWGSNRKGQLGIGSYEDQNKPTEVSGGFRFSSIDLSDSRTYGITTHGDSYFWGENELGSEKNSVPLRFGDLQRFAGIRLGGLHSCATTSSGKILCWGDNSWGQTGQKEWVATEYGSKLAHTKIPVPIFDKMTFKLVTTGWGHSCGLAFDGQAYCWGQDWDWQLDNGPWNNWGDNHDVPPVTVYRCPDGESASPDYKTTLDIIAHSIGYWVNDVKSDSIRADLHRAVEVDRRLKGFFSDLQLRLGACLIDRDYYENKLAELKKLKPLSAKVDELLKPWIIFPTARRSLSEQERKQLIGLLDQYVETAREVLR